MKIINFFYLAAMMIYLAGCTSIPTKDITFDSRADDQASFSSYKSYAWVGAAAIINDPKGQWEPPGFNADDAITSFINRELASHGWTENNANPDLLVAYAAGIDMQALGLKENQDNKRKILANVPQGGLAVVLVDNKTRYPIWVGLAVGELQKQPSIETAKGRLDYAVTELLKRIPD